MKQLRDSFTYSFKVGLRQWRIAAIVYLIQLCLALTLGMQVYEVIKASIGNSLEVNKLLYHYDHTVWTDFLKVHGASITPLIGQMRWLLLIWLLFSVFLDAGMLVCAADPARASSKLFWQGGGEYFFSFLKISLFFLLLAAIWSVVIFLPLALLLQPSLEYFSSEKYTVWMLLLALALWLAGLAVLFLWSVRSRFQRLTTQASIWKSIRTGWSTFWRNPLYYSGLLSGFVLLQLLALGLYLALEYHGGMISPILILVFFIVQQAATFFRIQIRQMVYTGICQK